MLLNRSTNLRFLGRSSCNILCVASENDDEDGSSELTRYFAERQYKANEDDDFDILMWWKTYVGIQHGGRVLSIFRNSLAPEMVEALICSEDWLRSSSSSADFMEEEGEPIPFLKNNTMKVTVGALHKDGKVMWPLDDAESGELERTYSSGHDES
ncbi:hypothetical protein SASPL_150959 [Salvia splendens]|uniref:HAT C-terminal dimerisation domain-containing protein n=1 Tax=Salvia splendens TaxID=180675 RepID=A0A8X8W8E9_SALSN|nr:hypothetical protein SASPL_150959 [Salvia splendens]